MKKFLSFLMILYISLNHLTAEEVKIDHPNPNKDPIVLIVPDTYEELKEAYIEMAKLYLGERYDLEQCLSDQEKLFKNYDKIKEEVITPLMDQLKKNEKAIKDIANKKVKIEPFQFGIFLQTGIELKNETIIHTFYGMPYIQLFQTINVGVFIGYPLQLGIGAGVQF